MSCRVAASSPSSSVNPPKITLKLPVQADEKPAGGATAADRAAKRSKLDVNGIPDEYEVVMPSHHVKNTFVFTEQSRTWVSQPGSGESSSMKRKREKGEP